MSPPPVALVTGATRGIGKGVALALADAGWTVAFTGRTEEGDLSLRATTDAITERGGTPVPIRCNHDDDEEVAAAFATLRERAGRLDLLVNNVFAIPSGDFWTKPFFELPIALWDQMHRVGLRSHFVASWHAAPLLIESGRGVIANISSFAGRSYQLNVAYGVGKAGVDRLAYDIAEELRPHGVAAVTLWPGIVRTEWVMENQGSLPFPLDVSESPELTGRVIAALAADPERMRHSGERLVVAELAEHYDITDVDGSRPPSLRRRRETT
ncbi:MAG: SDR family NAD(P)-dependent oxidoreductase [Deltaproteobacteria bacterium]|nr:SDR family NAD(P)-dependent oxidoreductase [Deltaproteobacteria bacterium]